MSVVDALLESVNNNGWMQLQMVMYDSFTVMNLLNTVYCKLFEVENFAVAELNCNSLENIHGPSQATNLQTLIAPTQKEGFAERWS